MNAFRRNNKPEWQIRKEAREKAETDRVEAQHAIAAKGDVRHFPSLGNISSAPKWEGKSFVALATEWKEAEVEKAENPIVEDDAPKLPTFRKKPIPIEREETVQFTPVAEDEWTTVNYKKMHVKKERVIPEMTDEEIREDDSYWDDEPPEHETCWDERRH
jgi:hypothetical protein